MLLSQPTIGVIAKGFRANSFPIPGPATGIDILRHSEGLKKWLAQYEKFNPGTPATDPIRREGTILVLEVIPMAMLEKYIEQNEKEGSHGGT